MTEEQPHLYWKVLTFQRDSALAWRVKEWGVHYPKGIKVVPKQKETKLMVFDSKERAEIFIERNAERFNYPLIIVPCHVENPVEQNHPVSIHITELDFEMCWLTKGKVDFGGIHIGAFFVDSVTCLE